MNLLGSLTPAPVLLADVAAQGKELNDFQGFGELVPELVEFLKTHGYEPTEKRGMLFAHDAGVGQHTDEGPIACWFLCGTNRTYMSAPSHELIVGAKSLPVKDGDVVFFDGRKKHALVAGVAGLWACYSIYVRKIRGFKPPADAL